jgi:phosphoribosylformimino-5-aminoimidazole carboxamide ribotide isomerase
VWHIASFRKSCRGKDKGLVLMQIWPAIDLRGGKCVRLRQGDYCQETVFGDDPAAMACRWMESGACQLHLVDLDGARDGTLANRAAVVAILDAVHIPCQLGGGIRDEATIADLFGLGLQRLVIGTQALKRPAWFRAMCRKFPGRLVVGIDARNGYVATDGWLETSQVEATTWAQELAKEPIAGVVYTDIAKDGMMAGPNLQAMAEMASTVAIPVIASGGVTTVEDVRRLTSTGVAGCIIGRSLYEGTLTLSDALAAAGPP